MKHKIAVVIEERRWKKRRLARAIEQAAGLAIEKGARPRRPRAMTVLLSNDKTLRGLNRLFRGKDDSTNVLSFPAAPNREYYLGDVAIALGTVEREAKKQAKSVSNHAVHLAVHGVLHLMGFDHERQKDARKMERLEVAILAELGVPDPYEGPPNGP